MKSAVKHVPSLVVDVSGLTLWLVERSKLSERPTWASGIFRWASERAPDVRLDARPVNSEAWFVNDVDHFRPEGRGGGCSRAQSG